jgi:acylphosphatase
MVHKLHNGAVEMVAQDHPDNIDDCIRQVQVAYKTHIRETKVEEIQLNSQYEDFKITFNQVKKSPVWSKNSFAV